MRKAIYVLVVSAFIGVLAGLLLNGSPVAADTCSNAYCGPGYSSCAYADNWDCILNSNGCTGAYFCY